MYVYTLLSCSSFPFLVEWVSTVLSTRLRFWCAYALGTRNYGLGMDALVIALTGTRTELWFGHGCSGELVTGGRIRALEVFVSMLGETWGRKAKP